MVWSKTEPATGKKKFVSKIGGVVFPTLDKSKALDDIPDGWEFNEEAFEKTGYIKFRAKR